MKSELLRWRGKLSVRVRRYLNRAVVIPETGDTL